MNTPIIVLSAITVTLLSACASTPMTTYSQVDLPMAVQAPADQKVAMETVGVGKITYECREKANMAGSYEWVFVGPDATLTNRAGMGIGKYYGPPATWLSNDGSKITGTQVAVAPSRPGSIPYQLVKANPASGPGSMSGVTYIQRVATQGGVAPTMTCDESTKGNKEIVNYQADYIFYTAK